MVQMENAADVVEKVYQVTMDYKVYRAPKGNEANLGCGASRVIWEFQGLMPIP